MRRVEGREISSSIIARHHRPIAAVMRAAIELSDMATRESGGVLSRLSSHAETANDEHHRITRPPRELNCGEALPRLGGSYLCMA